MQTFHSKVKPIPDNCQRIVLVNPTKYLGNLLIAGGLMQDYASFCRRENIALLIVVDEQFRELLNDAFPSANLIFYPRKKILSANIFQKIKKILACIMTIRSFNADLAFNLEEDSIANHLTRFSAAKFLLGCNQERHKKPYDHALSISFTNRPTHQQHRWHCYYEVFKALGLPESKPGYIELISQVSPSTLQLKLTPKKLNVEVPIIVVHACATKSYKMWPNNGFVKLVEILSNEGYQVVFIGSGPEDRVVNQHIIAALLNLSLPITPIDLADQLSLIELESLLIDAVALIGNDSGPSHFAAALGTPLCVIFGPTNVELWHPLAPAARSRVITSEKPCDSRCRRNTCQHNYRCLSAITPQQIKAGLDQILNESSTTSKHKKIA